MQISEFQQLFIWDKIINEWIQNNLIADPKINPVNNLLSLNSWELAKKAKEAWYILKSLNLTCNQFKKFDYRHEINAFIEWSHKYQSICKQNNYIEELPENFKNYRSISNDEVPIALHLPANGLYKVVAKDFIEELHSAAKWAISKQKLAKIGIVILDLEKNYPQVDYIFSNYLNSQQYKFDLEINIEKYRFIQIGLLILQFTNNIITNNMIAYQDFSKLLLTSFIVGNKIELSARSFLDYKLRQKVAYRVNWQDLKEYLLEISNSDHKVQIPILHQTLINFQELINKCLVNLHNDCQGWFEFINNILDVFAWGEENLDPETEELLKIWQQVLNAYLDLNYLLKPHEFSECLNCIHRLLSLYKLDPRLQEKLNTNDFFPIIVLDLDQALKKIYEFDYIWLCGASEIDLPRKVKFNPLLPIEIYQTFIADNKLINDPEIDCLSFKQLINYAKNQLICSYPLYINNNLVDPSPLIKDFNTIELNTLIVDPEQASLARENISLEKYRDDYTTIYPSNELHGINSLKLQIACPFQANAKIRLHAYGLINPSKYLTKIHLGELLHKTLADFWDKYSNLETARSLSKEKIYQELSKITLKNLKSLEKLRMHHLNSAIFQLEYDKIVKLCDNFINNHDLVRPFFQVVEVEKNTVVKLKELLINIRVDRIDQLANGDLLIIDYKTGKLLNNYGTNINSLYPDDPQLIIYSLIAKEEIKGLIIANISSDGINLSGVLNNQQILPEFSKNNFFYPVNWQEYFSVTLDNLYKIAVDFKQGLALVKPKYGNNTCRICDLQSFCRINHNF